jgi:hypothetical protein
VSAETNAIVTLRIFGDSLVPDEVTALIGVEPTRAHAKGDRHIGKDGREYAKRRIGMWQLRAPKGSESFESRVVDLLSLLPNPGTVWEVINQQFESDLSVGYFMERTNEEFLITAKVVNALATRGIALYLDIYDPAKDGEAASPNHSLEADGSAAAQLKR